MGKAYMGVDPANDQEHRRPQRGRQELMHLLQYGRRDPNRLFVLMLLLRLSMINPEGVVAPMDSNNKVFVSIEFFEGRVGRINSRSCAWIWHLMQLWDGT